MVDFLIAVFCCALVLALGVELVKLLIGEWRE